MGNPMNDVMRTALEAVRGKTIKIDTGGQMPFSGILTDVFPEHLVIDVKGIGLPHFGKTFVFTGHIRWICFE